MLTILNNHRLFSTRNVICGPYCRECFFKLVFLVFKLLETHKKVIGINQNTDKQVLNNSSRLFSHIICFRHPLTGEKPHIKCVTMPKALVSKREQHAVFVLCVFSFY